MALFLQRLVYAPLEHEYSFWVWKVKQMQMYFEGATLLVAKRNNLSQNLIDNSASVIKYQDLLLFSRQDFISQSSLLTIQSMSHIYWSVYFLGHWLCSNGAATFSRFVQFETNQWKMSVKRLVKCTYNVVINLGTADFS